MELLIFFLVVLFVIAYAAAIGVFSEQPESRHAKTPEELDQEAAWYRAEKRRLEAQTEYEMKHAELQDTQAFLKQRHGRQ